MNCHLCHDTLLLDSDLLEAGQLPMALQQLPLLAAEPFCLAVLLRCFQESLRRSRCSENELQVLGVGNGDQIERHRAISGEFEQI